MNKVGFDHEMYLEKQSQRIKERIDQFGGKLYLEFGGKLFDDYHAARVLPGFQPDSKINMLLQLREQVEIVIAVNTQDIGKNKVRGDLGITYDLDVLRLIDAFRDKGLYVGSVVMTKYDEQTGAGFKARLESQGVKVFKHYHIQGYPLDVDTILSEKGYGRNEYVETSKPLVVVTAPGPGSGKMATCLSQLYHENLRGIKAGYAKFETFPVWNLPLDHPVNLAYEAATADLSDVNMLDPYHMKAYNVPAVTYNRDKEIFPVLEAIFRRIWKEPVYRSPTDMGVNMIAMCICDDQAVRDAARQEIIRRYYNAQCMAKQGLSDGADAQKIKMIMDSADIEIEERPVIEAALQRERETGGPAAALQLPDGKIVVGRTTDLMGASAAVLLNALKYCANIPDEHKMISQDVIWPIQNLKVNHFKSRNKRLHTDEILIALSMCTANDELAAKAMDHMFDLQGCEAHTSVILSSVDERVFKNLGVNVTSEPKYQFQRLYNK